MLIAIEGVDGAGKRTLTDGLRRGDHAFRIGGDEFAVLLTEASETDAYAAAARIARALETAPTVWEWKLTTSFGVAVCEDAGCESSMLMRAADDAMYEMKRGRARSAGVPAVA